MTVAEPTNRPNIADVTIAMNMRIAMISVQPALMLLSISLRLITVTERKMKASNITRTSIRTVKAGFRSFIAPTGLVSMTSGEDQAQKASPKIKNTIVSSIVIIEERIISLLSGVSSLTVLHRPWNSRIYVSLLNIPTVKYLFRFSFRVLHYAHELLSVPKLPSHRLNQVLNHQAPHELDHGLV